MSAKIEEIKFSQFPQRVPILYKQVLYVTQKLIKNGSPNPHICTRRFELTTTLLRGLISIAITLLGSPKLCLPIYFQSEKSRAIKEKVARCLPPLSFTERNATKYLAVPYRKILQMIMAISFEFIALLQQYFV